jgi:GT2 family glycosyltransferase
MGVDLVISIVNHSNPELLKECLRSIFRSTHEISFEIWVIDNATEDGCFEWVRDHYPSVRWSFNQRRLGFSANHNQVLRDAKARYACILNDDILVHDYAFDRMIAFLDAHSEVGLLGPRLLNEDGSPQNSTFRFMSCYSELIGACWLPAACDHWKIRAQTGGPQEGAVDAVDWLLGACIVIRQSALLEIGLLDEQLSPVANSEDVDWCYRAHQKGWKVCFFPMASMLHYGGRSMKIEESGSSPAVIYVEMMRTRVAFFRKHHGLAAALLLRATYVIAFLWNLGMLGQSRLRGRLSSRDFRQRLANSGAVAANSLFSF